MKVCLVFLFVFQWKPSSNTDIKGRRQDPAHHVPALPSDEDKFCPGPPVAVLAEACLIDKMLCVVHNIILSYCNVTKAHHVSTLLGACLSSERLQEVAVGALSVKRIIRITIIIIKVVLL